MGLFGISLKPRGTINDIGVMMEKYLRKLHIDPHEQQVDSEDGWGWWVKRGSAVIYIFILEEKSGPIIKLTSPIVHFPVQNREGFFHHLLELNRDLNECSLAAFQGVVLLGCQRPTRGLDPEELEYMVSYVGAKADELDDKLAREFNATPYKEDPHCR